MEKTGYPNRILTVAHTTLIVVTEKYVHVLKRIIK